MHALQPKHIKLKTDEIKKLLKEYNISLSQLPKIRIDDPALPEGTQPGEVYRIERKEGDKVLVYHRVAVS
jgi:DNA-directed RNA polymerase subunit H (RpoH/RPB5)